MKKRTWPDYLAWEGELTPMTRLHILVIGRSIQVIELPRIRKPLISAEVVARDNPAVSKPLDELPHPAPFKARPLFFRSFLDLLIEAPLLYSEIAVEFLWSCANWIARSHRTQWKQRPPLRVIDPFHAPHQLS